MNKQSKEYTCFKQLLSKIMDARRSLSHRTRESGCRMRLRRFANFSRSKVKGSCNQGKEVL